MSGASTSTTDGLTRRQVAARQLEVWRRRWLLAARRSSCRAPPRSSSTARPVPANYLRKAAAIAVAVVGLRRSDCCADAPAELTLSWRLSLTGGRLDDRRDTCTRADMNVSISFVLLSMVVAKMCLRTVPDPIAGRGPRAHQTPFQPPRLRTRWSCVALLLVSPTSRRTRVQTSNVQLCARLASRRLALEQDLA